MSERKQHVIQKAHQLFLEKGFQATSIQDILAYSEISKGTFYNYFSSKSELLIAIIKNIYENLEKDRNALLIGQSPDNIEIFIKQVDLQLQTNRANKLISLFEEVIISNDEELKQFLKNGQVRMIRWFYNRFISIFGEKNQPYLLDCAIMFNGMLHYHLKYYKMCYGPNFDTEQIVRYSVKRIAAVVNELSQSKDQLIAPEVVANLLFTDEHSEKQKRLKEAVKLLKSKLPDNDEKYNELLTFIEDELQHTSPRQFLIESALASLKMAEAYFEKELLKKLETLVLQIKK